MHKDHAAAHRLLADATDNPLIVSFEGAMTAVLHYLFGSGASVPPEQALGGIAEVIEMVRKQDPGGARTAMARHLEHSVAHIELRLPAEQGRSGL